MTCRNPQQHRALAGAVCDSGWPRAGENLMIPNDTGLGIKLAVQPLAARLAWIVAGATGHRTMRDEVLSSTSYGRNQDA